MASTHSPSLQDNTVRSDTSITVLGVVLDDKLKFDEHVSVLCLKASKQINALKRISKYLDEKCRIMVYKSFISSNFNYCPVAWMFCGKKNLVKLEKLQERVLRFVFCDATASYEDLMERGNFLPLSLYRIRCLGIEVFKCFHGLNPAYLNDIFIQPSLNYNPRDSCRLEQPKFRTFTYGLRSFRYYGSKLWNLLPYQVKNTRDIVTFKINITEWCHSKQCISLEIFESANISVIHLSAACRQKPGPCTENWQVFYFYFIHLYTIDYLDLFSRHLCHFISECL